MKSMQIARRVFVIGLDGAAGWAIRDAYTPNIDNLFKDGVITYNAKTVFPSSSYEAWGALLHGVGPEKHQITGDNPCSEDTPWPSFFKIAIETNPELRCGFFSCWEPIITKIIEPSVREHCRTLSLTDPHLAEVSSYFIIEKKPEMFFIQLDNPDHYGHRYGWGSKTYMEHLTETDSHVGIIIDAIKKAELLDESLIIVVSDHGGIGKRHGTADPESMNIVLGIRGPKINTETKIDGINIMDVPAIVAYALSLPSPEGWDSKIPENLFQKE